MTDRPASSPPLNRPPLTAALLEVGRTIEAAGADAGDWLDQADIEGTPERKDLTRIAVRHQVGIPAVSTACRNVLTTCGSGGPAPPPPPPEPPPAPKNGHTSTTCLNQLWHPEPTVILNGGAVCGTCGASR